jgi:hypothetical protein
MTKDMSLDDAIAVESGSGIGASLHKAEIDQQISTAKRFPRSVSKFMRDVEGLATMSDAVAEECTYAIPRDGKTIEGPSARLAEIVAHAWGNCRAGARVLDDSGDYVVAQGIFMDLERNVAISYEARRRITTRSGSRFSADMIAVTANAACSIALRNAIFKGVPKAFWSSAYEKAREVLAGTEETLARRRDIAVAFLKSKHGVTLPRILHALRDSAGAPLRGIEDITSEHLVTLRGILTALKEAETTVEESFPDPNAPAKPEVKMNPTGVAAVAAMLAGKPVEMEHKVADVIITATADVTVAPTGETTVESLTFTAEPAAEEARPGCMSPGCTVESAPGSTFCEEHNIQPKGRGRRNG